MICAYSVRHCRHGRDQGLALMELSELRLILSKAQRVAGVNRDMSWSAERGALEWEGGETEERPAGEEGVKQKGPENRWDWRWSECLWLQLQTGKWWGQDQGQGQERTGRLPSRGPVSGSEVVCIYPSLNGSDLNSACHWETGQWIFSFLWIHVKSMQAVLVHANTLILPHPRRRFLKVHIWTCK